MRSRWAWLVLGWLIAVVASPRVAGAHPLQFSYIDLNITPASTDVVVTIHAFDAAHDLGLASEALVLAPDFVAANGSRLADLLLSRLRLTTDGQRLDATLDDIEVVPAQLAVVLRVRYPTVASAEALDIDGWLFPYDPLHQTFVKIYERATITHQDILTVERRAMRYVPGGTQSRLDVVRRFVASGITHIAIGPDHVLFLVGLLLLGGNLWQLVRIVTGFTVAHSVTLSLAALGILTPPARVVEPIIALSICYVGVDNLLHRPGGRDNRAWIALGFGLIHGFGFASVLREMDLPREWLAWSLFAFNLGVEIGQLVIVVLLTLLLGWIARRSALASRRVAVAGSILVIWAGFFWFVERAFFA